MFGPDEGSSSVMSPVVLGFAVVGFVAVLLVLFDALREIAQGFVAHLVPTVLPDRTPMNVKYGAWAGQ